MPTRPGATSSHKEKLTYNGHETFLPYLLNRVTSELNAEFSLALRSYGLSITHWRVLAFLNEHTGLGVNALSEVTGTDQATLSRALARMGRLGLIEQGTDSRDSRVVVTSISAGGRKLFAAVLPLALMLSSRAARGISPEALAVTVDVLQTLQRNLAAGGEQEEL